MSGPGARLSASVAVMKSASDVASTIAVRQACQRFAGHAIGRPLVHRHRTEALVEVDRSLIPIQDRPLEPTAAPLHGKAGQVLQQRGAAAMAAKLLAHVQIL